MKTNLKIYLLLLALLSLPGFAHAQGTAIGYQGRLNDNDAPANGLYDLKFTVYDAPSGGNAVGSTVDVNDLGVINGLFTVTLDPGANVFTGAARWLNISVRPGASLGVYTDLSPRQALTATPYALYALTPAGPQGSQGPKGDPGEVGAAGTTGASGPQGFPGVEGAVGSVGPQGLVGSTGNTGSTGPASEAGPTGATGPIGPEGLKWRGSWTGTATFVLNDAVAHNGSSWMAKAGSSGTAPIEGSADWDLLAMKGDVGATGEPGPIGTTGSTGLTGFQGPSGPTGDTGPAGPTGAQGPAGSPDGWSRTGNAGTSAGVNFIGTTDNQPLDFKVNGTRVLRLEPRSGATSGGQAISTSMGAWLSDGGAWNNASDRNRKDGFSPVNPREVLNKVAALQIQTWHYTNETAEIRHLGPVAQDFHAAFGLGSDDKSISTVDAAGVALAAIQGLNQKLEEKDARIAALERSVAELKTLVSGLAQKNGGSR